MVLFVNDAKTPQISLSRTVGIIGHLFLGQTISCKELLQKSSGLLSR